MGVYEKLLRPILFLQDPEKIHDRFVIIGRIFGSTPLLSWPLSWVYSYYNPLLDQTVRHVRFKNPVGLAAGFDKDCKLLGSMPSMGFGYEEVGTITAEPYEGNKGVRLKRLPEDRAIIVNYGLKNQGAVALKKKLNKRFRFPVGVSIGKTNRDFKTEKAKLDDWIKGIKILKDSGDYITLNLSCPNLSDSTNFCEPDKMESLLKTIQRKKIKFDKPLFLKITHTIDKKHADRIIRVCNRHGFVDGFILTNLGKNRSSLKLKSPKEMYEHQKGGISGQVVKPHALELVRYFYKKARHKYVIIGCGGIYNAEDAYEYIKNGATLLQLITGMIYCGPGTIKKINKGLVKLMREDGYQHISEAIGSALKK